MAQLQATGITGSLVTTGDITGSSNLQLNGGNITTNAADINITPGSAAVNVNGKLGISSELGVIGNTTLRGQVGVVGTISTLSPTTILNLSATDSINLAKNTTITGTLSGSGILNLSATDSINLAKNTTITGTLSGSGNFITAGDLAVNGGDITSTAGSDFRITPSGSFARLIIKPVATNQQAWLQLDATGENAVINALTADQLGIRINNTERMTINALEAAFNNNIAANGGSITSTAATLNINAGGTVNIDDNTKVTGSLTIRTGDGKAAVLAMSNGNGYRASLSAVSDNPAGFTGFDFNAHGNTVAKINYGAPANDDLTFELKTFNNAAIGPNFVFSTSTGQKWRLKSDSGNLVFFNASDISELQLSQTGDLSLGGNLIMPAAAGISFANTTPDGAGVTSELFSDYEEGTWTPTFIGTTTAGSYTYVAQEATYTKIGNVVYIAAYVDITATVAAPTGQIAISGLPFTIKNTTTNNSAGSCCIGTWNNFTATISSMGAIFQENTTRILLYRALPAGTTSLIGQVLSAAELGTGGIRISGFYIV